MSEIKWEPWNGVAVSEARRQEWADQIAEGVAASFLSGDSMVFGEIDTANGERVIELTDVQVRRTARVPLPDGCKIDKYDRLRCAAPDLADALAEYVAEVDRDGLPSVEWSDANLAKMRAALRKAGRLP